MRVQRTGPGRERMTYSVVRKCVVEELGGHGKSFRKYQAHSPMVCTSKHTIITVDVFGRIELVRRIVHHLAVGPPRI